MEVYIKEGQTEGTTFRSTPSIEGGDETVLRRLFPEAWENPNHECPVASNQLTDRLERATSAIAENLGLSANSNEVTKEMQPYQEFVQHLSKFEQSGKTPVAVVQGISSGSSSNR